MSTVTCSVIDAKVMHVTSERLASALQATFQLPEGNSLVSVLGKGNKPDNRAALASWVEQQLKNDDKEYVMFMMNLLVARLDQLLRQRERLLWL